MEKVVTRIAPSPTGLFHIGTARTALFNYLFARQHGGKFYVRIEDTDKARCKEEYEKDILDNMAWLGLEYDGLEKQSERSSLHAEKLKELIDADKAYISKEPAKDDPSVTVEVVRLRNPGTVVKFTDLIRGEISFDTTELGDFVIARSVTDPLYHFAVVVDDVDMEVTHVIRGEDHISNTPRQILILEALGCERPQYAHIPLTLAADRSKLSKRKGAVSITEYRKQGFLPSALNNYFALLGWNSGTEKEIYTMEELIHDFKIEQIQKSGAVFSMDKLKWVQKEHRKTVSKEEVRKEIEEVLQNHPEILKALLRSDRAFDDVCERHVLKSELEEAVGQGEYDFYEKRPTVTREVLAWKKDSNPERAPERVGVLIDRLEKIDSTTFNYDTVKNTVWDYAEQEGKGEILWPMRYALSGKERSPDPFLLAEALGKDETLARLTDAYSVLQQ